MKKKQNFTSKDGMEEKIFPTTLGLFLEWYIGYPVFHNGENLYPEDVTETMLKDTLGSQVFNVFDDEEHCWDIALGTPKGTFGNDTKKVADYFREYFYTRTYLIEIHCWSVCCARFTNHVDGLQFEVETLLYWGENEEEINEYGRPVIK